MVICTGGGRSDFCCPRTEGPITSDIRTSPIKYGIERCIVSCFIRSSLSSAPRGICFSWNFDRARRRKRTVQHAAIVIAGNDRVARALDAHGPEPVPAGTDGSVRRQLRIRPAELCERPDDDRVLSWNTRGGSQLPTEQPAKSAGQLPPGALNRRLLPQHDENRRHGLAIDAR